MSVESAEYAAVDATLRSTQWTAIFIAVNAANDISYDAAELATKRSAQFTAQRTAKHPSHDPTVFIAVDPALDASV